MAQDEKGEWSGKATVVAPVRPTSPARIPPPPGEEEPVWVMRESYRQKKMREEARAAKAAQDLADQAARESLTHSPLPPLSYQRLDPAPEWAEEAGEVETDTLLPDGAGLNGSAAAAAADADPDSPSKKAKKKEGAPLSRRLPLANEPPCPGLLGGAH